MAAAFRLPAPLLALLLPACWTGAPFYSDEDVRAPIPPGVYRALKGDAAADEGRLQVSVGADGYTRLMERGDARPTLAGFAPLPGREGAYVAWFKVWEPGRQADELPYALLERHGGEYWIRLPMCSQTRAVAEALGAAFLTDPKVPLCRFGDRAALEEGLRRVATGEMETMRLIPMEKGSPR